MSGGEKTTDPFWGLIQTDKESIEREIEAAAVKAAINDNVAKCKVSNKEQQPCCDKNKSSHRKTGNGKKSHNTKKTRKKTPSTTDEPKKKKEDVKASVPTVDKNKPPNVVFSWAKTVPTKAMEVKLQASFRPEPVELIWHIERKIYESPPITIKGGTYEGNLLISGKNYSVEPLEIKYYTFHVDIYIVEAEKEARADDARDPLTGLREHIPKSQDSTFDLEDDSMDMVLEEQDPSMDLDTSVMSEGSSITRSTLLETLVRKQLAKSEPTLNDGIESNTTSERSTKSHPEREMRMEYHEDQAERREVYPDHSVGYLQPPARKELSRIVDSRQSAPRPTDTRQTASRPIDSRQSATAEWVMRNGNRSHESRLGEHQDAEKTQSRDSVSRPSTGSAGVQSVNSSEQELLRFMDPVVRTVSDPSSLNKQYDGEDKGRHQRSALSHTHSERHLSDNEPRDQEFQGRQRPGRRSVEFSSDTESGHRSQDDERYRNERLSREQKSSPVLFRRTADPYTGHDRGSPYTRRKEYNSSPTREDRDWDHTDSSLGEPQSRSTPTPSLRRPLVTTRAPPVPATDTNTRTNREEKTSRENFNLFDVVLSGIGKHISWHTSIGTGYVTVVTAREDSARAVTTQPVTTCALDKRLGFQTEHRRQDLEDTVLSLKGVLRQREKEVDELRATNRAVEGDMHQLRASFKNLQEHTKSTNPLDDVTTITVTPAKSVDSEATEQQLNGLIRERENLKTEVFKLTKELEKCRADSAANKPSSPGHTESPLVLQHKIDDLKNHVKGLEEGKARAGEDMLRMEQELTSARAEVERMREAASTCQQLQQENSMLRRQMEEISAGRPGGTDSPDAYLQGEVEHLHQELRALQDRNYQLVQDNIKLTRHLRQEHHPQQTATEEHAARTRRREVHAQKTRSRSSSDWDRHDGDGHNYSQHHERSHSESRQYSQRPPSNHSDTPAHSEDKMSNGDVDSHEDAGYGSLSRLGKYTELHREQTYKNYNDKSSTLPASTHYTRNKGHTLEVPKSERRMSDVSNSTVELAMASPSGTDMKYSNSLPQVSVHDNHSSKRYSADTKMPQFREGNFSERRKECVDDVMDDLKRPVSRPTYRTQAVADVTETEVPRHKMEVGSGTRGRTTAGEYHHSNTKYGTSPHHPRCYDDKQVSSHSSRSLDTSRLSDEFIVHGPSGGLGDEGMVMDEMSLVDHNLYHRDLSERGESFSSDKTLVGDEISLPDDRADHKGHNKIRRDSLDSDSTEALMIEADRELTITSRPADHREYVNGHSDPRGQPSSADPTRRGHNHQGNRSHMADPSPQQHRSILTSPKKDMSFSASGRRAFSPNTPADINLGNIVKFSRQGGRISRGVVRYLGHLPGKNDTYLGVELEQEIGKHDGIYEGQRYFNSKPNKGVFVAFSKVVMAWGD